MSNTRVTISQDFFISYWSGAYARGEYITDTVQFAGVTLKFFHWAVAMASSQPGIIGLGYPNNQAAVLKGNSQEDLLDILIHEKLIKAKAFSIWMEDLNAGGYLLLGGYDKAKFLGKLSTNIETLQLTSTASNFRKEISRYICHQSANLFPFRLFSIQARAVRIF